jgi:hypothetical protein
MVAGGEFQHDDEQRHADAVVEQRLTDDLDLKALGRAGGL